jgi:hypothetical protein|tara:strand:+ start:142 stop:315 length:174 start_codon:yes stop_codon:yes gene_type:complete
MKKYKKKPWTDVERKMLAAHYFGQDIEAMMNMLPERTEQAIRNQVAYLRKRGVRFKQ